MADLLGRIDVPAIGINKSLKDSASYSSAPRISAAINSVLCGCERQGESMKKFGLLGAAAMVFAASPSYAAPLLFTFNGSSLTGPVTASFQLDSNPTPSSINNQSAFGFGQIFFNNIAGIFNGVAETASSISFGTGSASQFQIQSPSSGFAQFGGATVFTGSFANPVFSPGSYAFTGFSSGTLTISQVAAAVPEPSTWGLMILGMGAVGYTMRRRKVMVRVARAA